MARPDRRLTKRKSSAFPVENDLDWRHEALCTLIEDSKLRKQLGNNAHKDVLIHHTLAAQADQGQRPTRELLP